MPPHHQAAANDRFGVPPLPIHHLSLVEPRRAEIVRDYRPPFDVPEPFIDEDEGVYEWMEQTRLVWGRRIAWFAYAVAVIIVCYFAWQFAR